jgi:hypothetical protein
VIQNGRQQPQPPHRKQLSDQLDRFDAILDGLAEGLNGAIADAAREGTRLAVKDAILEIVANPDLRAALQSTGPAPVPPPAASPPRSVWESMKALLRRARAAVAAAVRAARTCAGRKVRSLGRLSAGAGLAITRAWRVKLAVLATVAVGVAAGVGAYYLTPHAGMVVSAVAGACAAVVSKTAVAVRAALRPLLTA